MNRDAVRILTSASRGIRMYDNSVVKNLAVEATSPDLVGFNILANYVTGVRVWEVRASYAKINIGVNGSSDVRILDTYMHLPGGNTSAAQPNLWINDSSEVAVRYGVAYGRKNGPGGDGEIAAHNSNYLLFEGTHIVDSGASALYLVNCDDCTVMGMTIVRPDEWGLDIVSGSDRALVINNSVTNARFGGAVFYEFDSIGGDFINNSFNHNVQGTWTTPCNGINVRGNPVNVGNSGNTSTSAPVICQISVGPP